jgi:hypothetical protein
LRELPELTQEMSERMDGTRRYAIDHLTERPNGMVLTLPGSNTQRGDDTELVVLPRRQLGPPLPRHPLTQSLSTGAINAGAHDVISGIGIRPDDPT